MQLAPTNGELRDRLLHGGGKEQIEGLGFRTPPDAMNAFQLWGSILEITAPYRRETGDRLFENLSEAEKQVYRDKVVARYNANR